MLKQSVGREVGGPLSSIISELLIKDERRCIDMKRSVIVVHAKLNIIERLFSSIAASLYFSEGW